MRLCYLIVMSFSVQWLKDQGIVEKLVDFIHPTADSEVSIIMYMYNVCTGTYMYMHTHTVCVCGVCACAHVSSSTYMYMYLRNSFVAFV